jgi:hypothetical protein
MPTAFAGLTTSSMPTADGRWISLSYDRLHTFGYRFDTF